MGKSKKSKDAEKKLRYEIDLQGVTLKQEFHDRIQASLPCPEYYGRNLDALYDVLTESGRERELVFQNYGDFARELPGYFAALRELCEEAMEECAGLRVVFSDGGN